MITTQELRAAANHEEAKMNLGAAGVMREAASTIEELCKQIDGTVRVAAQALARVKELEQA